MKADLILKNYEIAKERYAALGVDTDKAIETLEKTPISLHCWQGDDVRGFDTDPNAPLTGGIQTTGNYPGRARNSEGRHILESVACPDIHNARLTQSIGKIRRNADTGFAVLYPKFSGLVIRA